MKRFEALNKRESNLTLVSTFLLRMLDKNEELQSRTQTLGCSPIVRELVLSLTRLSFPLHNRLGMRLYPSSCWNYPLTKDTLLRPVWKMMSLLERLTQDERKEFEQQIKAQFEVNYKVRETIFRAGKEFSADLRIRIDRDFKRDTANPNMISAATSNGT